MRHNNQLASILGRGPVVPVLTLGDPLQAVTVASALIEGGVDVLEVTLRTPRAIDVIHAIAQAYPDAVVGAGTVLDIAQAGAAEKAGARFLVSPGASDALIRGAEQISLPWLFGVSTISEAMELRERGFKVLKFFPAEASGGVPVLQAWSAVLPDLLFCPTGGITEENAAVYLRLPNVLAVGGSWLASARALHSGDMKGIAERASRAVLLRDPMT